LKIAWYGVLNAIFGFTFTIKLMEKGEDKANTTLTVTSPTMYRKPRRLPLPKKKRMNTNSLQLLDEDRLQYVGSMVLGLNDALVELTGTLAGLSLALQNTKLIALSGLVTGISATLSMMSSEYLSARSDGNPHPFKSASYTGIMYIAAVVDAGAALPGFGFAILPDCVGINADHCHSDHPRVYVLRCSRQRPRLQEAFLGNGHYLNVRGRVCLCHRDPGQTTVGD
jgi:hypothetical protein